MAKLSFHAHSLPDLHACVHSCNHPHSAKHPSYSLRRTNLQRAQVTISALNKTLEGDSSPAMTFYDVLSVSQSVELDELKKAYREKVSFYLPDVCPPAHREESFKMFLQVLEAYQILSDPTLRADYDFNLHINPQIMLLKKRNGNVRDAAAKQQFPEQLQWLNRGVEMERDSSSKPIVNMRYIRRWQPNNLSSQTSVMGRQSS